MLQVAWALFIVTMVAGLAYFTSRFLGRRMIGLSQGRLIRVLEVAGLGPRRQVCILSVGDRAFLVGVTDQCVSGIAELDANVVCPAAKGGRGNTDGVRPDFFSKLCGILGKSEGERNG
ncbi:MAG: flagellar biosynthetic protein FliO [Firmicutes bacterium]|jgi:flagellar biosynthetic protein FliO|nr:flagellar biosynthetic protein FliO [Bacillota bacterium]